MRTHQEAKCIKAIFGAQTYYQNKTNFIKKKIGILFNFQLYIYKISIKFYFIEKKGSIITTIPSSYY